MPSRPGPRQRWDMHDEKARRPEHRHAERARVLSSTVRHVTDGSIGWHYGSASDYTHATASRPTDAPWPVDTRRGVDKRERLVRLSEPMGLRAAISKRATEGPMSRTMLVVDDDASIRE